MWQLSDTLEPEIELHREELLDLDAPHAGNRALLMTSLLFSTVRGMGALQSPAEREVFELLLVNLATDLIPAERGAVILDGSDPERQYDQLVRRVSQEQVGTLVNEDGESIIGAQLSVRDLVEAGLVEAAVQGVMFLCSRSIVFDEGQLQMLATVAVMAGAALEYRKTFDWLLQENQRLQAEVDLRHSMVGESPVMLALFEQLQRVSITDSTVLILGESGTGKEMVARAVHQNSPPATRPFVAVDFGRSDHNL